MARPTLLALVLLVVAVTTAPVAAWRSGRATFYGNEPHLWSIHQGSCGFGYLWPDQGTGWDVAALADTDHSYAGSCGRCYEVRCKAQQVRDGYGESMDRHSVCRDGAASVVVRTTDTCPCNYPSNYYSNKRWCCGDVPHLDLSVYAFAKLADVKWGVIGIEFREVACSHAPDKRAHAPAGACPPGEFPSEGAAKARHGFDWHKYFAGGGYLHRSQSWVATGEFMKKAGLAS